jgi:H+-translocating diphosphatase
MMEEVNAVVLIISLSVMGLLFGIYNIYKVLSVIPREIGSEGKENESLIPSLLPIEKVKKLILVSDLISEGAGVFLFWEYCCLFVFIALFGSLIYCTAEHIPGTCYTTVAFVTGAITSMACGYIGMKIATKSNYRTCYKAQ